MKKIKMFSGIFYIALLAFSCTPGSVPQEKLSLPGPLAQEPQSAPKEPWELKWDGILREAKKEGRVNIYANLAPTLRNKFSESFKNRFGLEIEWTIGGGSEIGQKIFSERRAGLYLADISLHGSSTLLTLLKPSGILEPLEPKLILPEVKDSSKWLYNEFPWVDKDRLVINAGGTPSSNILLNTDKVPPQEMTSYRDLLNPRWKGRIVVQDPTRDGPSLYWVSVVGMEIMGEDYLRELAKQGLIFVADKRLPVEWVAKGKADIAIAPSSSILTDFIEAGAKNLKLITPREGGYQTGGGHSVVLINKGPHTNASMVFLNWFLSREAQELYVLYDWRPGLRTDIDISRVPKEKLRQLNIKYFNVEKEEFFLKQLEFRKKLVEIFGPYMR